MTLDAEERIGMAIIFGRFESGRDFDWARGQWKEADA